MRDYKEFLKLEDEVKLGFIQRRIADVQGELILQTKNGLADGQEDVMVYEMLNQIWDRVDAMRVQKQGEK